MDNFRGHDPLDDLLEKARALIERLLCCRDLAYFKNRIDHGDWISGDAAIAGHWANRLLVGRLP